MSLLVKAGCRPQLHQSHPSPFLHGMWFKTGVSLLCERDGRAGLPIPLCLSMSPPTASTPAARETFAFSPQQKLRKVIAAGSHAGRSLK